MNKFFNAIVKETGKEVTLRKEKEGTLFENFYVDYRHNEYYTEDEFEKLENFEPLVIKLNDKETLDYEKFCEEHVHKGDGCGISGGIHSLIFTGTGIGYVIEARCNHCDEVKDITDYS